MSPRHVAAALAVSVVINCRNGERYLREALDSVFSQTYDDWEIIFWDNLSTDGSADIARAYGERVRYFRGGPLRLYAARNRAIEKAQGRYLGFLDTDDVWLPHKLELQVPRFEQDPDVALVYSNGELFDDTGGQRLRYRRRQREGAIFRQVLANYHLLLPTVMIRRGAYDDCGGFEDKMETAGDADLFMRICRRYRAAYVHAVTARSREHTASLTAAHPEYLLREADFLLKRLREADPDLDLTYAPEVTGFLLQRRKAFMIGTWRKGDASSTRRQVWAYLRVMPVMLALSIASLLPFGTVYWLRQRSPFRRLRRHHAPDPRQSDRPGDDEPSSVSSPR